MCLDSLHLDTAFSQPVKIIGFEVDSASEYLNAEYFIEDSEVLTLGLHLLHKYGRRIVVI